MPRKSNELLHGALDALILRAVAGDADHGYGIVRRIEAATNGAVVVEDGSLYPALYRLERKGYLRGDWGVTEGKRRARFYKLTRSGRRQLDAETESWARLAAAVQGVLSS